MFTKSAGAGIQARHNWIPRRPELRRPAAPGSALTSRGGQRLFLGLERQIQVFELFLFLRPLRSCAASSGVSFPRCDLDRSQDGLAWCSANSQQFAKTSSNLPDLLFIQAAGLVLAVTGNEGNGIAFVQQTDDDGSAPRRRESLRRAAPPSLDRWQVSSLGPCRQIRRYQSKRALD